MNQKSQSVLEFVVTFTVIITAIILMAPYLRNSFSGKIKEAGDVFGKGEQYQPNGTSVSQ